MHGMTYIGRVISNFRDFYNDINGATLTGAIDVIVVEQPDGTCNCSPFHVRFGKIGVLRSREKVVDIEVNGEPLDIHMKLGESGEAFFVEEIQDSDNEDIPDHLATSPIPVSNFEALYNTSKQRRRNSLDLDVVKANPFENEVNDYTKRRHTASTDDQTSAKMRERDFFQRQIGLGNIELMEASAEDLTLSLPSTSNRLSSGDLSQANSVSEPIFKMDSLEMDKPMPLPVLPPPPQAESASIELRQEESVGEKSKSEETGEGKGGKKKRRRKSVMKKKNSVKKTMNVEVEVVDGPSQSTETSAADSSTAQRSSLDSVSDVELKHAQQKSEHEMTPIGNREMLDPDFHFFSDTELTSGITDSRPCTPANLESVLSDTEFEVKHRKGETQDMTAQSWAWGEFPISKSQPTSPVSDCIASSTSKQNQSSMINSVWSFMIYQRKNTNNEGMYLADLCSGAVNPEVAALYIPDAKKEDNRDGDVDCESGNGPSLTQSPTSGAGCKSIDSDFEEHNKSTQNYLSEVALSLCGWDPQPNEELFMRHQIPYLDYCNNPSIIESPKLVVRIDDKYYTWKVAAPMISSLMVFHRSLPQYAVDQLCRMHMPTSAAVTDDKGKGESARKYSWWGWPRSRSSRETTPASAEPIAPVSECDQAVKEAEEEAAEEAAANAEVAALSQANNSSAIPEEGYSGSQSSSSDNGKDTVTEEKSRSTLQDVTSAKSDKYKKTLRLSSEQIKRLNLREGMNEVEFSVTTAYQGTTRCKCHLYKWKWDDKIVISDIDGTITKSDVLGHILPIVGKDWAQSGVAQLFNKIKDNGYKLLYLSARAIGQARVTREYLKSIKQNDLYMPDGPILLNPTSLITAFHREVIEKKPEQFKISCMSDIRALFPTDANPFYAGYGNRINDVWAYRAVGIPIVRIFTINPKGELKHELTQTFQSSYSNMSNYVDQLFPLIQEAANDYSQFSYWRDPLPIVDEIDEIKDQAA